MERFAGRYTLVRPLGSGGMGDVYLALDRATGRECALKRLRRGSFAPDPESLRREFEVLSGIRHPLVVRVLDFGHAHDGTPWYTMEYVPGTPIHRAGVSGDWRQVAALGAQIASGLEALHAHGILHGDLKPGNILTLPVGDGLAVRLVDFGLASLLGRDTAGHRGTPGYVAPEVVRGAPQSVASDLYGLGAVLFELGARRVPGPDCSASELMASGAPEALVRQVLRLMAHEPGERPAGAREVRRELEVLAPAARRALSERLQVETVIGRERELGDLERWLALAPDGAAVTFLTGESGIGRSAVLGAIAARAALTRRRVCRLSCGAFPGGGELAAAVLRHLAIEAALESEPGAVDEGTFLARGLEAGRALGRSGTQVLVLLDDAERIDAVSRGMFRRLALHPELRCVRWIPAFVGQPSDLADEDQLLVDSGEARLLPLGPLDRCAADRLVASRLQDDPPPALGEALWERAGGSPGLIVELLRVATEGGVLRERDGRLELDAPGLATLALPRSLEEARRSRFEALGEEARALALLLAAVGRSVPETELPDGAGGREALAELARAGLVHHETDRGWRLSPPGLAAPLLGTLRAERRRALHEQVLARIALAEPERFDHLRDAGCAAAALACAAAVLDRAADEKLALAAAQLAEETAPGDSPGWQLRAAKILIEHGRYTAAVPFLERALEGGPGRADRPETWHLLVASKLRNSPAPEVHALVDRAMAEAPPPRYEALLLCSRASALSGTGDLRAARETADRAMEIAGGLGDDDLTGTTSLVRGTIARHLVDYDEARRLGEQAEQAYARAGNEIGRIRSIGLRGSVTSDLDEADALYALALSQARSRDARMAASDLLIGRANALVDNGHLPQARDAFRESYRIALEDGRVRSASHALGGMVHADVYMGELARARQSIRPALRMGRRFFPFALPLLWRIIARMLRLTGRERAARRALERAFASAQGQQVAWCELEAALHLARLGRWPVARCRGQAGLAQAQDPEVRILLHALVGRAALRAGDADAAGRHLSECRSALASRTSAFFTAPAQLLEAEMHFAAGRIEEAVRAGEAALAGFTGLPAPADRAGAAVDLAALALEREGPAPPALERWLADAIETCARLGDHAGRERALALEVDRLRRIVPAAPGRPTGDLLRSVGKLLSSLTDLTELAKRAMAMAVEQLGAERGVLLLQQEGALVPVVEYGVLDSASRERALGFSGRVVERVAKSGGSLVISDATTDPGASESMFDLRSIVCVPLLGAGQVIGAVYLDDSRRPGAFNHADRKLLEGFAELVALAIEKSRGHEAIERENELLVGENLSLRRRAGLRFQSGSFIAASAAMQDVLAVVERAAQVSSTVLITGENGTGKELVARILHHNGKRGAKPFVAVNCGAIPSTLLESELFGILPNVATGVRGREGRFIEANGGTLFLDEIGDMPLPQQVALLSVISNREVTPVGGGRPAKVDVRIIAATNRDLRRRVEEGAFREDLYYRLNVIPIEIPPLRKRKADIPALALHFAANFAAQQEREVPEFAADFMATLMQSEWPGNVRELQNYIERVMAMTPGRTLRPKPLPHDLEIRAPRPVRQLDRPLLEEIEDFERRHIERALTRTRGNQTRAAEELGLTEHSLRYRIRKYGLPDFRRYRQKPRKSD